ncbi:hypothetical protein BH10PSE5_BH10PSE5_04920 [soil metagenome]
MAATLDHSLLVLGPAMDAAFYGATYPDLAASGADVTAHYAESGWREGRDPAPWFSTTGYLDRYPDVAASGGNPFYHYLAVGRREGREAVPSARALAYLESQKQIRDGKADVPVTVADRDLAAAEFDSAYYLFNNPDVAAAGLDPLDHFLQRGWKEGRDPSRDFSLADYLELNPDVAAAGVQPFVHYLAQGRHEGRIAIRRLGFRHDAVARARPLQERLADCEVWARAVVLSPAETLVAGLAPSRSEQRDVHVTFSHDNYAAVVGGVQASVQREALRFGEMGRDHLHLYPASPWPIVASGLDGPPLGVLWNGEKVGAFAPAALIKGLKTAFADWRPGARSFAVHSMLGHSSREVIDVVRIAGAQAGWYWTHDFTSLCAGIHLLRNDIEDCGAPPPGSPACGICLYGPYRDLHIAEHSRLFRHLDLTLASPSQAALDTWKGGSDLDAIETRVQPLARLAPSRARPRTPAPGPFRFAFPGTPSLHKGWPIFRDLAIRFERDPRYAFLHLGKTPMSGLPLEHHPVSANARKPMAMRDALKRLDVDAAMIWSLCRETFSLTAYEAAAAGAAIVTGPDSGNIAAFTQGGGHGLVLPTEAALFAMFESGEILSLARARRAPPLFDLEFSNLSADLIAEALS